MALRAVDGAMSAAQWKGGQIVIELCRLPCVVVVANPAISGVIAGHVVRIRGALKIRLMARKTIFWCAGKTAIHMALGAIDGIVGAQQGKCCAAVIEARRFPGIRGVTLRART